jgi:UMF1 family MFS transporter
MVYHIPFNSKKLINRWAMYDWANSAFALVITSAVFPPFFTGVAERAAKAGHGFMLGDKTYINFLGITFEANALYSYALSFAFLTLMILSPMLSGIADASGKKKMMMKMFCYIGSFSCMILLFFVPEFFWIGVVGIILGMIGYNGSIIYYNAFLPLITTEENYDRVSARGYAYGYLGSVILLVINLLMITFPENFGLGSGPEARGLAARISFLSVGVWWIVFSQFTFRALPTEDMGITSHPNYFRNGLHRLQDVWGEVKHLPMTRRYLVGFFFCAMSLQTILYIATLFAKDEIHMEQGELIEMVLLLQLVATVGAVLFAKISNRIGNIITICIAVVIWIIICISAYFITGKMAFFILASFVGLVMGALQSLNRSTFSKLIPENSPNLASYYSFLDVTEKAAITVGTFMYATFTQITGSMRDAILFFSAYFLIALYFYARVKISNRVLL